MSSKSSKKRFRSKADGVVLLPGSSSSSQSDSENEEPPARQQKAEGVGSNQAEQGQQRRVDQENSSEDDSVADPWSEESRDLADEGEHFIADLQPSSPLRNDQDNDGNPEPVLAEGDNESEDGGDIGINPGMEQPHLPHDGTQVEHGQQLPFAGVDSKGDSSDAESSSSEENLEDEDVDSVDSEEEIDHPEEIIQNEDGNAPLYNGASLTVLQSVTAIMTFVFTHALTKSCLVDLLLLIALHCPANSRCVKSLYKLKKFFKDVGKEVLVCHYYCSNCFELLHDKNAQCGQCQEKTEVSYFIEIPLLHQLQMLFKRPGFYEDLQHRFQRVKKNPNNIEDVYDGNIYKAHVRSGFLNKSNHISFMWYADGISVFKFSNKFSIWPLYFVINELSYKQRVKRQNIILAGIWFGSKKPKVNTFLGPYHTEMAQFYQDGYMVDLPDGSRIRIKGALLRGTCDMPAKSCFLRWKHHNGYYGCFRCYTKGQQFEAGSNVHVYPHEENIQLRKNEEVETHSQVAIASGSPCYGIKGLSILYRMMLDMVRSTGIDAMHGAFSGVCKLLLELWFDSKFREMNFSMYHLIQSVDKRVLAFKVPSFLKKFPRSVGDLAGWKSLDFKVFLLYYCIPVLMGIMPNAYMEHHMLLVSGLYLLSQRSISPGQVERASLSLKQYVKEFEQLYHLRFMSINVHQLIHYGADPCQSDKRFATYFFNFVVIGIYGTL